MKKTIYILLILLIYTTSYAQEVISNSALSSQKHMQSTMHSSSYGIGASQPSYQFSTSSGSYSPSVRIHSYSPSGSKYSSNIYTPFTTTAPQAIRRTDSDDDDDDDEPGTDKHPGDPGPPMPLGNGLWIMILLAIGYATKQLKQHTL